MRVVWRNIGDDKFEGEFIELDNGTAIMKMDDGTKMATDADCLILASEKHLYKGWD